MSSLQVSQITQYSSSLMILISPPEETMCISALKMSVNYVHGIMSPCTKGLEVLVVLLQVGFWLSLLESLLKKLIIRTDNRLGIVYGLEQLIGWLEILGQLELEGILIVQMNLSVCEMMLIVILSLFLKVVIRLAVSSISTFNLVDDQICHLAFRLLLISIWKLNSFGIECQICFCFLVFTIVKCNLFGFDFSIVLKGFQIYLIANISLIDYLRLYFLDFYYFEIIIHYFQPNYN